MPSIYLNTSYRESSATVESDAACINHIADALEPYLVSCGILLTRNHPGKTTAQMIRQANVGNPDLILGLYANESPITLSGRMRGTDIYYCHKNAEGQRAADIFAQNLKKIYPLWAMIRVTPTTSIAEVVRVKATSVLIRLAYADNKQDAEWVRDSTDAIAKNLAQALALFFDIPFVYPFSVKSATAVTEGGNLNIHSKPDLAAPVIGSIPNGARAEVLGRWREWYVVRYQGIVGYASIARLRVSGPPA